MIVVQFENGETATEAFLLDDAIYKTKHECELFGGNRLNDYREWLNEYIANEPDLRDIQMQVRIIGYECREADGSSIRTTP